MMYILFLIIVLFPEQAAAYLDPFTGSLLLQGLIAGVIAVTYFVKKKWQQLRSLFGFKSNSNNLENIIDQKDNSMTECETIPENNIDQKDKGN